MIFYKIVQYAQSLATAPKTCCTKSYAQNNVICYASVHSQQVIKVSELSFPRRLKIELKCKKNRLLNKVIKKMAKP